MHGHHSYLGIIAIVLHFLKNHMGWKHSKVAAAWPLSLVNMSRDPSALYQFERCRHIFVEHLIMMICYKFHIYLLKNSIMTNHGYGLPWKHTSCLAVVFPKYLTENKSVLNVCKYVYLTAPGLNKNVKLSLASVII